MNRQHASANHQASVVTEPQPARPESGSQPQGNFELWSDWASQAASAGTTLAELLSVEIRLALGDARRMLLLALLSLPIALLAWLGFTALMAWLVGSYCDSTAVGLLAFFLQQCAVLLLMGWLWRRYKRSLSLPLTREHWQAFTGGMRQHEAQTPGA